MQAAAWGLLSLDNYVSQSAVSAPLRARLGHWRGELRRAIPPADAKVVCKLFLEFLDGLVKERLSGDELASVDAALEKLRGGHTRASSELAAADLQAHVDACRVAIGARARSRRKASAKQRAPWLLKKRRELHQRTERQNVQVVRDRDRIMKFKHDCITLPTAPVLALEELQKLRARGDAAISSTTPQVPTAPAHCRADPSPKPSPSPNPNANPTRAHPPAATPTPTPTPAPLARRRSLSRGSFPIGLMRTSCPTGRRRACCGSSSRCSAALRDASVRVRVRTRGRIRLRVQG